MNETQNSSNTFIWINGAALFFLLLGLILVAPSEKGSEELEKVYKKANQYG